MSARRTPDPEKQVINDEQNRVRVFKSCTHPYEDNEPSGYIAWHVWAQEHHRTHVHDPCPDCGLHVICRRR